MGVKRFGVSIPGELLDKFDAAIERKGYKNRSEAIRDLIRASLIGGASSGGRRGVGVLSFVYDHSIPKLEKTLTAIQHESGGMVVTSMHVHLDERNCLEVVVLRGKPRAMRVFADRVRGVKGVKHGSFSPMLGVTDLP